MVKDETHGSKCLQKGIVALPVLFQPMMRSFVYYRIGFFFWMDFRLSWRPQLLTIVCFLYNVILGLKETYLIRFQDVSPHDVMETVHLI